MQQPVLREVVNTAASALLAYASGKFVYEKFFRGNRASPIPGSSPEEAAAAASVLRNESVVAAVAGGAAVAIGGVLVARLLRARHRRLRRKQRDQLRNTPQCPPPFICRICHEEDTLQQLVQPCECRGTQARPPSFRLL